MAWRSRHCRLIILGVAAAILSANSGCRNKRMEAQVEGRLAYLKTELGITEPQAEAWKQYEDAVRSRPSAVQGMRQEMMKAMQGGSVADRVKTRITMMEEMVASMKAQSTAIENLYKVLTDEQKKKGDQLLRMGRM